MGIAVSGKIVFTLRRGSVSHETSSARCLVNMTNMYVNGVRYLAINVLFKVIHTAASHHDIITIQQDGDDTMRSL